MGPGDEVPVRDSFRVDVAYAAMDIEDLVYAVLGVSCAISTS